MRYGSMIYSFFIGHSEGTVYKVFVQKLGEAKGRKMTFETLNIYFRASLKMMYIVARRAEIVEKKDLVLVKCSIKDV